MVDQIATFGGVLAVLFVMLGAARVLVAWQDHRDRRRLRRAGKDA